MQVCVYVFHYLGFELPPSSTYPHADSTHNPYLKGVGSQTTLEHQQVCDVFRWQVSPPTFWLKKTVEQCNAALLSLAHFNLTVSVFLGGAIFVFQFDRFHSLLLSLFEYLHHVIDLLQKLFWPLVWVWVTRVACVLVQRLTKGFAPNNDFLDFVSWV